MSRKMNMEQNDKEGGNAKRKGQVFFKRIGSFSSCPKSEFEKSRVRDVTVI